MPKDEAGILWDAVCFTFLLIQRRVFMSYYYLYIVTDLKATDFLASRYLSTIFEFTTILHLVIVSGVGNKAKNG